MRVPSWFVEPARPKHNTKRQAARRSSAPLTIDHYDATEEIDMPQTPRSLWFTAADPDLAVVWDALLSRTKRDQPAVARESGQVPAELMSIGGLVRSRALVVRREAAAAVHSHLDPLVRGLELDVEPVKPASSPARGRRRERALAVARAESASHCEAVLTLVEQHRGDLFELRELGLGAMKILDARFRAAHRRGALFGYELPVDIDLPDELFEIGQTRLAALLPAADGTSGPGASTAETDETRATDPITDTDSTTKTQEDAA